MLKDPAPSMETARAAYLVTNMSHDPLHMPDNGYTQLNMTFHSTFSIQPIKHQVSALPEHSSIEMLIARHYFLIKKKIVHFMGCCPIQLLKKVKYLDFKFRRVLNVVCFLLGDSLASEIYMPTFRNTLSVSSS